MLCRLCVYECLDESANELESNLRALIAKYLYIEISPNDDQTASVICPNCLLRLKDFDDFFKTIEARQKVLHQIPRNAKDVIKLEKTEVNTHLKISFDEFNEEIKPEIIDPEPKSEYSFIDGVVQQFEFTNTACTTDIDEDSDDKEDVLLLSELKAKAQLGKSKFKKSTDGNCKVKRKYRKKVKNKIEEEKRKKQAKNILSPEEEKRKNDLVAEYISFDCELCDQKHKSETYLDFQKHFRTVHKQKAFITCCGKHLNKRSLMLEHVKFHANPELYKCDLCGKALKSRVSLKNHEKIFHKRTELEHGCKLCGKTFPYPSMLKTHMAVHEETRCHVCEICQKGFKSKTSLQWHIHNMHGERNLHICDICGKEYKFKQSFEQHVAEHKGTYIGQRKQCDICKVWVAAGYFKRHVQRHETVDVACEECGQKFTSIPCLVSHKERHHRKVKPKLDCPYCDKTFERRRYLKEHIDVHTGHKAYTCKHCPREFRSSANMYAHQKKAHYEQWVQAQLSRTQDPNNMQSTAENKEEDRVVASSMC